MAIQQGTLSTFQQNEKVIFRADGCARMAQGLALRRCGEQALSSGVTTLWVDLRHCEHMDSTFLGTLLYLKRAVHQRCRGEFALVSPSPQCCQLLAQMSMDGVFPTMTAEEADALPWIQVSCEMERGDGFKNKVVQAHQELADLPGKAGEPFRQVVHSLKQDMEAYKGK